MTADPFLDFPADTPKLPGAGRRWLKRSKWIALAVLVALLLYYPIGMIIVHKINDDPSFSAGQRAAGPEPGRRPGRRADPARSGRDVLASQ